jgi:hypothetical protein
MAIEEVTLSEIVGTGTLIDRQADRGNIETRTLWGQKEHRR